MAFLELYEYEKCARYISNYIQYEQLDPPTEFPSVIPSPTNVARWQKGDCFDMSILLTSILIGCGFDAYCCYGKAPREITTKNESEMECLFIDKGKVNEHDDDAAVEQKEENEFTMNKKQKIYSKYDRKLQDQQEKDKQEQIRKAMTIDDDEPDTLNDGTII